MEDLGVLFNSSTDQTELGHDKSRARESEKQLEQDLPDHIKTSASNYGFGAFLSVKPTSSEP
jgi:hypothetical protein